jgi:hypothetical protein
VGRNIKDNEIGSPTFGYNDFSKSYVHFKNLPKIVAEIEEQILNQKMETMVKQKTIKTEISLTGVGLHTGKEVK